MDGTSGIRTASVVGRLAVACMVGMLTLPGLAHAGVAYNTSLASPPGVYFGSGNSNSGFTVDTENNVEIGLSAINRYIGPITPVGDVYVVRLGDTTVPGQTGSAWGIDFSINLRAPSGSLTLSDIDAVLTLTDVRTGFSHSFAGFLAGIPDNTCYNGSVAACTDSTDYGVQNSEPGSLFSSLLIGDTNFNDQVADTYLITLDVYGCSGAGCTTNLLATDSIQVNAVPEPGALGILGTALAGLGLLGYRRGLGRRAVDSNG